MRDLPPRQRTLAGHPVDRRPAARDVRRSPDAIPAQAARQSDHADDRSAPDRRRDGGARRLFRQPAGTTVSVSGEILQTNLSAKAAPKLQRTLIDEVGNVIVLWQKWLHAPHPHRMRLSAIVFQCATSLFGCSGWKIC